MQYWLVKSEPDAYSFDDLIKDGRTMWEGVRNYQARNNMRNMKEGDEVLYYHSRQGLEVVGIAKVIREAYPDPTAEKGDWSVVDLEPLRRLEKPVTLKAIKEQADLQDLALVRNGRLSVMPVPEAAYRLILRMAGESS